MCHYLQHEGLRLNPSKASGGKQKEAAGCVTLGMSLNPSSLSLPHQTETTALSSRDGCEDKMNEHMHKA